MSRLAGSQRASAESCHTPRPLPDQRFDDDLSPASSLLRRTLLAETERRYSLTVCISARKARVIGNPDMGLDSTSIVEQANLDIRTRVRRTTRLTNRYSKRAENHAHAFSL